MDENDRRTRASAEASQWWTELNSSAVPHSQRRQYVRWLRESPVHVEEMLRVGQVYRALKDFDAWELVSTRGAENEQIADFPRLPLDSSLAMTPAGDRDATPDAKSEAKKAPWRSVIWPA